VWSAESAVLLMVQGAKPRTAWSVPTSHRRARFAASSMAAFDRRWPGGQAWSIRPRCLLMALFRHPTGTDECPLSGIKRTWRWRWIMSA